MEFSLLVFADGNGFKTSTMRLGADVIVFSRSQGKDGERFSFFLHSMFILNFLQFLCIAFSVMGGLFFLVKNSSSSFFFNVKSR